MTKIARSGAEGNVRLLKQYGGGSTGPKQSYAKGYASGGSVRGDNPALSEGISAAGGPAKPSLARGGKKASKGAKGKGGTNVNVVIVPKPDGAGAPSAGLPVGGPPPGAALPPPMPMPPSGAGPGGPGPMPPMPMRKHGGRVHGEPDADDKGRARKSAGGPAKPLTPSKGLAKPGMDGGAGGALGRLEKAKKYGR